MAELLVHDGGRRATGAGHRRPPGPGTPCRPWCAPGPVRLPRRGWGRDRACGAAALPAAYIGGCATSGSTCAEASSGCEARNARGGIWPPSSAPSPARGVAATASRPGEIAPRAGPRPAREDGPALGAGTDTPGWVSSRRPDGSWEELRLAAVRARRQGVVEQPADARWRMGVSRRGRVRLAALQLHRPGRGRRLDRGGGLVVYGYG